MTFALRRRACEIDCNEKFCAPPIEINVCTRAYVCMRACWRCVRIVRTLYERPTFLLDTYPHVRGCVHLGYIFTDIYPCTHRYTSFSIASSSSSHLPLLLLPLLRLLRLALETIATSECCYTVDELLSLESALPTL